MTFKITYSYFFSLLMMAFLMSSCKEDSLGDVEAGSGLGGDEVAPTAIDKYLLDSLTTPYNNSNEIPLGSV